jgi:transposase
MKQAKSNVFIGVDVSKNSLDVAVGPSGETIGFANSEDGIALLADFIKPLAPTLVLFEATGGGEMNAVRHLAAQRLPLVVLNPRQVRDFAKATGQLAKTDAIDTRILARFGEAVRPEVRPLKPLELRKLEALNTPRRQIVEMITAEQNRLVSAPEWTRPDIEELIAILKKRLAAINRDLNQLIRKKPPVARKGQDPSELPRRGPCHGLDDDRRSAGTRHPEPTGELCAGWRGPPELRQRNLQGQTQYLGGQGRHPLGALDVHADGHPP